MWSICRHFKQCISSKSGGHSRLGKIVKYIKRYAFPLFCVSLSGCIESFTTASVFPISCFAVFIGSIRHGEPSLTNSGPSLFSLHRYNLPVGKRGGSCAIEIVAENGAARHLQEDVSPPAPEVMWPACNQLNALSSSYVKLASRSTVCACPFRRVRRFPSDSVTLAITGSAIRETGALTALLIPFHSFQNIFRAWFFFVCRHIFWIYLSKYYIF